MIFLIDLLMVFCLVGIVLYHHLVIGVYVLLITLFFGSQYWKTLLLMGDSNATNKPSRRVMAGVLSVIFTGLLAVLMKMDVVPFNEKAFSEIWNDDLFPVFLAVGLLSALFTVTLATERRKR